MQHVTTRPWATAGVVLASAGLIAATPVTPHLTDVQARAVQLTAAFDDLVNPYSTLFENTWTNLEAIGTEWAAHPAPFLTQALQNQAGFGQGIAAALQAGDLDAVRNIADLAPRTMAQNFLNVTHALTDTSFSLDLEHVIGDPSAGDVLSALGALLTGNKTTFFGALTKIVDALGSGSPSLNMGIPLALAVDALGAPYHGATALLASGTALSGAVQAGDWSTALAGAFTAPATITDSFLNAPNVDLFEALGSFGSVLGLDLNIDQLASAAAIDLGAAGKISVGGLHGTFPLSGLLAPLGHPEIGATIDYSGATFCPTINIFGCGTGFLQGKLVTFDPKSFPLDLKFGGTETGGLVPALVNWLPQQLADEINGTVPGSWSDISTQFQDLPNWLWSNFQLTSLFGEQGWLGMLTSALGLDSLGLGSLFDLGGLGGLFDPTVLGADLVPNLLGALLGF